MSNRAYLNPSCAEVTLTQDEATKACTKIFQRAMATQATLSSALQVPEVFPEFKKTILKGHIDGRSLAKKMLSDLLVPRPTDEGWFDQFAEGLADEAIVNAENVLSAAVIVLAHSNADEAFSSACQIAMGLDPKSWIVTTVF